MADLWQAHRTADLVDAELKGRMFRGFAAVYDTPWNETLTGVTGYVEKVARGAFRRALAQKPDVPLLLGHDRHQFLGRTGSGNVRIIDEPKGLLVEAKLPDNHLGEYARSMIASGDMKGMSYGIELDPVKDVLRSAANGVQTRTVTNLKRILDVTLTWEPAYEATTAELRSASFVALPSQENPVGEEPQGGAAEGEAPPDDVEAWWGEHPADDPLRREGIAERFDETGAPPRKPWWDTYLEHLEEV